MNKKKKNNITVWKGAGCEEKTVPYNQELKMAGLIGPIGPFDKSIEHWSSCTERFDYFVVAKDI